RRAGVERQSAGAGRRGAGASGRVAARPGRRSARGRGPPMTGLLIALAGAYGVWLLYTALACGWTGIAPGPRLRRGAATRRRMISASFKTWLVQAGLETVGIREFAAVVVALFLAGA